MTNNDLIERIADAIEEWFATHDGEEIDCRALARLAVMQGEVGGLREAPTEAMVVAGHDAMAQAMNHTGPIATRRAALETYRAMVDAALTNKGANP